MKDLPHRVIIASGFAISLGLYSRLPGPFLTGPFLVIGPVQLAPRPLIAFVLPATALVIHLLLSIMLEKNGADVDSEATYRGIMLAVVSFVIGLHVLLLAGLSGAIGGRAVMGRGIVVLFGVLLIAVGNLLPRTRPNIAFGIRTTRTLADRDLWMHINRLGGYVAVAWGAVIVLAGAFLTKPAMPVVVQAAGFAGLIALVRSYRKRVNARHT